LIKRINIYISISILNDIFDNVFQGTANPEGYISTLPGSSVVFHWPRNDYDQLLCVRRMDTPNCTWSGGFEVNKPKSFHVNMRSDAWT